MIAQARRRVQQPGSVLLGADKPFKLDLVNRQRTATCCAHRMAGVDVNRPSQIAAVDAAVTQ
jgi:hypothetical protein